jgi:hypothetical protein
MPSPLLTQIARQQQVVLAEAGTTGQALRPRPSAEADTPAEGPRIRRTARSDPSDHLSHPVMRAP